jgi:hypothetical protein
MTPDALVSSLYRRGITLTAADGELRWHGPKGVMSPALLAELKQHKPLVLTVLRTIDDAHDEWGVIRGWVAAPESIIPRHIAEAGQRVGLPYSDDLWPEAYTRRLRMALHVRGILRGFRPPRPDVHETPAATSIEMEA